MKIYFSIIINNLLLYYVKNFYKNVKIIKFIFLNQLINIEQIFKLLTFIN